jgi:putative transposase
VLLTKYRHKVFTQEILDKLELSKLINSLKTVTSRAIRKEFEQHIGQFYWKPLLWTRAYYIAGGAPLDITKEYIENQGKEK